MRLLYVAHPVGQEPERTANIERTQRWFRYLLGAYPDAALVVPWLVYVQNLDETPDNRLRGIRDDLAVLSRCDAIVLVGGHLSPGMERELDVARKLGLAVENLLHLGQEPPE